MKKNIKKLFLSITFLFAMSICYQYSYASVLDVIKDTFNSITQNNIDSNEDKNSDKEMVDVSALSNKDLTDDEKEVLDEIIKTVESIKKIDLDTLVGEIDVKKIGTTIDAIKDFFNEYEDAFEDAKYILSQIEFKIVDIDKSGDKIIAKIEISLPNIKKVRDIVLPEIMLKNATSILSKNITNKNIASIIKSVRSALSNNKIDLETIDFDIEFKKINGIWVATNLENLFKEFEDILK